MRIMGMFVNYRTSELTIRAVGVLIREYEKVGPFRILVVDNDSQDGSYERLCQAVAENGWDGRVSIIAAPRNGGYGYGMNLAVRTGLSSTDRPDYFHVINTDAFPDPDSIRKLLEFMDSHPDAGMAGSRIHGEDGATQGSAFRFLSIWSELERGAALGIISRALESYIVSPPPPPGTVAVDWLHGTSLIIRRAVFEAGVFFDEDFFLYFEEVDFARQLRNAGFRAYYVEDAPITHIGSVSTGLADAYRSMPTYWFDSRHHYFNKHHGRSYTLACDAAWLLGHLIFRAKITLLRRPDIVRRHLLRDFMLASLRFVRSANG